MAEPTLYWNPFSHNARIVYWFLVKSGLSSSTQFKILDLSKGEHKTPEFLAVNPAGQIPAYTDGSLSLFEGSSIIRYLAAKHRSDLYPLHDATRLGPIDAVYQHIRSGVWDVLSGIVFQTLIIPSRGGKTDPERVQFLLKKADDSLKFFNDSFFATSPDYVVGDRLSIADIALGTAILQATQLAKPQYDISKFPRIVHWWNKLQETDHFKQAHQPFFDLLRASSNLTLYWFPFSHFSRLVYWYLSYTGILPSVTIKVINLGTQEQKSPEFLAINPNGQIPALTDGNLKLFESSAILRYLAAKYPSDLLPLNDAKRLAPIDSIYTHIRAGLFDALAAITVQVFFGPKFLGLKTDEQELARLQKKADEGMQLISDKYFLESPEFVVGDRFSLADIVLATGILHVQTFAKGAYDVSKFPKIDAWFKKLQETEQFKRAHQPFYDLLRAFQIQ